MTTKHLYQPGEDITLTPRPIPTDTPVEPPSNTPVAVPAQEPSQVFTLAKTAVETFPLDGTCIAPSRAVMLSGARFAKTYEEQLNALLYNDEEQLDHEALMLLTSLSDIHEKTQRPIRLISQSLRQKIPLVCTALNKFYRDNHAVLRGISQQLA